MDTGRPFSLGLVTPVVAPTRMIPNASRKQPVRIDADRSGCVPEATELKIGRAHIRTPALTPSYVQKREEQKSHGPTGTRYIQDDKSPD